MFESIFSNKRLFSAALLFIFVIFSSSFSTTVLAKRSPEEVFKYQKHMAQAGYASAIYKLAVMYQNGYGTERDLKQALELYKEAAAKGYKKAESRIAEIELMIESGDFNNSNGNSRQKALEAEQAQLEAERQKLQQEREALAKARLEQQRLKQQAANSQKAAEEQRLAEERRRLNEEMEKLRAEKERMAKEKLELELAKKRAEEEEMRALEESTIMLMDSGQ